MSDEPIPFPRSPEYFNEVEINKAGSATSSAIFEALRELPPEVSIPALACAIASFCGSNTQRGQELHGLDTIYEIAKAVIKHNLPKHGSHPR